MHRQHAGVHPRNAAALFGAGVDVAVDDGFGVDALHAAVAGIQRAGVEVVGDWLADAIDFDAGNNGVVALRGKPAVPGGEAVDVNDLQGVAVFVSSGATEDGQDQAFAIARGATGDGLADFGERVAAGDFADFAFRPVGPGVLNGDAGAIIRGAGRVVDQRDEARRIGADEVGFDDVEVVASEVVVVFQRARAVAQGVEVVADLVVDFFLRDLPARGQAIELGGSKATRLRGLAKGFYGLRDALDDAH